MSGKKKGGAVFMGPRDMICTVNVSDGSSFKMYACVRGSIIEINKRLVDEPELLSADPQVGSRHVVPSQGWGRRPGRALGVVHVGNCARWMFWHAGREVSVRMAIIGASPAS